jgi:hypothetical protein
MKYAFVMGSSAFIVPHGIIRYADDDNTTEILKVNSLWHDNEPNSIFSIDLDIKDTSGNGVIVSNNKALGTGVSVIADGKSVQVLDESGVNIIKVIQMDDKTAMGLEHNITAEFEVNLPLAAIRIFGDFFTHDLHILAENEKFYINDDGYATSALAGKDLRFTPAGVALL